jgi:hypothetical protein
VTRRNAFQRLVPALPLLALAAAAGGCGSSSATQQPTIQKALQIQIADLEPSAPIAPGKPTTISFKILQPSGTQLVTMTKFRRGSGPHTGVHMIIVRDDLGVIIHRHPPIGPGGKFTQTVTFPKPGPYRMVLDVYPALTGGAQGFQQTNFQLFGTIKVAGAYRPETLPKPARAVTVDGYHLRIVKIVPSPLKAISSALVYMTVTDPSGQPVTFTPWYGALAHAIFFHQGRFEYFHTHVCSPGAGGCASVLAGSRVTGSSATPGHITVGVLLPDSGTWRLFLQFQSKGRIVTAPFTLPVGA